MKQWAKLTVCLLLLAVLCACGSYESRLAGTWEGDGSLDVGVREQDGPIPFNGAERWEFDGDSAVVATVDGKDVKFHYYASDDTLTLNDGGEVSWGVLYKLRGDTLRIGDAVYTKVR